MLEDIKDVHIHQAMNSEIANLYKMDDSLLKFQYFGVSVQSNFGEQVATISN